MRTELGAHVRTSDGQDVGTIDRLILDPASRGVKAVVIRKGVVLPRDVEVPLSALEPGADGAACLRSTAEQVADLPQFDESRYTGVPPVGYVPLFGYAEAGLYWPVSAINAGMPLPPVSAGDPVALSEAPGERSAEARRQDRDNAVLQDGSMVMSRDEQQVGTVQQLVFDTESGQVSHLRVRRGFLFAETFDLPVGLIARVDDDIIHLTAAADDVLGETPPTRPSEQ